jgi:steroid delta-isomerase-like uncharacterized protein
MATAEEDRRAARFAVVKAHVQTENDHDLSGIMATMSLSPSFVFNGQSYNGHENVHRFYAEFLDSFPDAHFDVVRHYVSEEAMIVELVVSGTQAQPWLGSPATGRRFEVPACAIFLFDEHEMLATERVYCDMALLLRQLGGLP